MQISVAAYDPHEKILSEKFLDKLPTKVGKVGRPMVQVRKRKPFSKMVWTTGTRLRGNVVPRDGQGKAGGGPFGNC